jgi:hypothetical protein
VKCADIKSDGQNNVFQRSRFIGVAITRRVHWRCITILPAATITNGAEIEAPFCGLFSFVSAGPLFQAFRRCQIPSHAEK